ncbi:MAG: hypothetical protein KC635_23070 [Myxococcales bacterium]|nr:hypothetical protein [Myxococcales bacterium]MCB9734480.1 hypothetical protein [Deltaproteobacteria bacterium]
MRSPAHVVRGVVVALSLALVAACGGDGSDTTDTAPPDDTASPADAADADALDATDAVDTVCPPMSGPYGPCDPAEPCVSEIHCCCGECYPSLCTCTPHGWQCAINDTCYLRQSCSSSCDGDVARLAAAVAEAGEAATVVVRLGGARSNPGWAVIGGDARPVDEAGARVAAGVDENATLITGGGITDWVFRTGEGDDGALIVVAADTGRVVLEATFGATAEVVTPSTSSPAAALGPDYCGRSDAIAAATVDAYRGQAVPAPVGAGAIEYVWRETALPDALTRSGSRVSWLVVELPDEWLVLASVHPPASD